MRGHIIQLFQCACRLILNSLTDGFSCGFYTHIWTYSANNYLSGGEILSLEIEFDNKFQHKVCEENGTDQILLCIVALGVQHVYTVEHAKFELKYSTYTVVVN